MLYPKERKERPDNINHPVSSDNVNGPASAACQSLIIHHDECCGENSKHRSSSSHSFTISESTNLRVFFSGNFFVLSFYKVHTSFLLRSKMLIQWKLDLRKPKLGKNLD